MPFLITLFGTHYQRTTKSTLTLPVLHADDNSGRHSGFCGLCWFLGKLIDVVFLCGRNLRSKLIILVKDYHHNSDAKKHNYYALNMSKVSSKEPVQV